MAYCETFYGPTKRRGLKAVTFIPAGTVVFTEDPLVMIQFSWNEKYGYRACHYCMRPLETAEENVRRLTASDNLSLPYSNLCHILPLRNGFSVCAGCGEEYCSEQCREKAYNKYHKTICRANGTISSKFLDNFEALWNSIHYPPETSNIMLLVRMVAMVIQADDKEALLNAFDRFCQTPIENGFMLKMIKENESNLSTMFELFRENLNTPYLANWMTYDGFKRLIALVCRNAQGIATSSFSLWVRAAEAQFNCDKEYEGFVDDLYNKIDSTVGEFIDNEGIGLFQQQSLLNHSCSPNCQVKFTGENSTLSVVTLNDITPDEELTISYLSECDIGRSRHSRQKQLKDFYLFSCECPKCVAGLQEPDITSEEEYDDDDDEFME